MSPERHRRRLSWRGLPWRGLPGRRLFIGVTTGVVAGVLVAACGGGGKKPSSPSASDGVNATCALLTREEVERAIVAPVREGQGTSGTACRFDLAGGPDQAVLLVKNTDPSNPANFDRAMAEAKDARDLPGAGYRAFVTGKQAMVLKGDTIAIVVANLQRPAPALADVAANLAVAMAPRI